MNTSPKEVILQNKAQYQDIDQNNRPRNLSKYLWFSLTIISITLLIGTATFYSSNDSRKTSSYLSTAFHFDVNKYIVGVNIEDPSILTSTSEPTAAPVHPPTPSPTILTNLGQTVTVNDAKHGPDLPPPAVPDNKLKPDDSTKSFDSSTTSVKDSESELVDADSSLKENEPAVAVASHVASKVEKVVSKGPDNPPAIGSVDGTRDDKVIAMKGPDAMKSS
jgi:hypothetical protein